MKNVFVLVAILFSHSFVNAEQFMKAKIIFRNDSVLTGLASMPNDPPDLPIFYKDDKRAKSRPIRYTDVRTIIYYFESGKTLEYDVVWTDIGHGSNHHQEKYMRVVARGAVTLYTHSEFGGPNKYDQDTYFLCLKAGEETVTLIAGSYGKYKKEFFKNAISEYFRDDHDLVAKVVQGQYKWSDMDKIVNEYNLKKK